MATAPQVNALERGLDILLYLNLHNEAPVAEIARGVSLPRTTTFRLLETLSKAGFLERNAWDNRYRLTSKVWGLSDGYDSLSWLADAARPHLKALSSQVIWPVLIAVPRGNAMIWRESTERDSPLTLKQYPSGHQLPMAQTTTGLIYLAFLLKNQAKFKSLPAEVKADIASFFRSEQEFNRKLDQIRTDGYALYTHKEWREGLLAVPVIGRGRFFGALAMRYAIRTVARNQVTEKFLGLLQVSATNIAATLLTLDRRDHLR